MKIPTSKLLTSATTLAGLLFVANPASAFDPSVFQSFIQKERQAVDPAKVNLFQLDPAKLNLIYDHEVKVHFLSEGAAFRNQFGATVTGTTNINDTILFDEISCLTASCSTLTGYQQPGIGSSTIAKGGLTAGESVSLGNVTAGSTLDFWLNANGFLKPNATRWSTDTAKNKDGLQHVMAYEYEDYLVLAWEDLVRGGDQDYNDAVFAIDIGKANLQKIREESQDVPEPSTTAALLGVMAFGLSRLRRRQDLDVN
ncbi:MAG: DUF4114 domain-containing protein [Geitlerinemataceae cyanobacterium]